MEEIAHRNRYVATLKLAPFYSDPNIFLEWFYRSHQYERSKDMAPFILILGLRDSPLKINMVRFGPRIKHIDLKSTYQTKHNNANSATQHGPTRLRPIAVANPIAVVPIAVAIAVRNRHISGIMLPQVIVLLNHIRSQILKVLFGIVHMRPKL